MIDSMMPSPWQPQRFSLPAVCRQAWVAWLVWVCSWPGTAQGTERSPLDGLVAAAEVAVVVEDASELAVNGPPALALVGLSIPEWGPGELGVLRGPEGALAVLRLEALTDVGVVGSAPLAILRWGSALAPMVATTGLDGVACERLRQRVRGAVPTHLRAWLKEGVCLVWVGGCGRLPCPDLDSPRALARANRKAQSVMEKLPRRGLRVLWRAASVRQWLGAQLGKVVNGLQMVALQLDASGSPWTGRLLLATHASMPSGMEPLEGQPVLAFADAPLAVVASLSPAVLERVGRQGPPGVPSALAGLWGEHAWAVLARSEARLAAWTWLGVNAEATAPQDTHDFHAFVKCRAAAGCPVIRQGAPARLLTRRHDQGLEIRGTREPGNEPAWETVTLPEEAPLAVARIQVRGRRLATLLESIPLLRGAASAELRPLLAARELWSPSLWRVRDLTAWVQPERPLKNVWRVPFTLRVEMKERASPPSTPHRP
jgi:hypothetical protein